MNYNDDKKVLLGLGGILAILAIGRTILINRKGKDQTEKIEKECGLGILGMQASGKTSFLSFLKKQPYSNQQTHIDEYEPFIYKTDNGKNIKITKGKDIGGGEYLWKHHYKEIIDSSDVIFYFFDIKKYLENIEYMRECNSRLHFLYREYNNDKNKKKRIILFATHKDQTNLKDNEILNQFINKIKDKEYEKLANKVEPINITDKVELKKVTDKTFENI